MRRRNQGELSHAVPYLENQGIKLCLWTPGASRSLRGEGEIFDALAGPRAERAGREGRSK